MNVVNSYVGQPIERIEDLRLLRGRGQFVDDLHLDGMLHAAILRSSIPHGRILHVDTAAALAMPGVAAVFTAAEIGSPVPTIPLRLIPLDDLVPYEQPVIASGKVRYVGEPIAVVVAASAAIAEDALELIAVEIEALPPCVDTRTAAANQSLLFEETGTNLALTYTAVLGDADAAFAAATSDELLYPPRALRHPTPHRDDHGDAWPHRCVGQREAAPDCLRRRKGSVRLARHACQADRSA